MFLQHPDLVLYLKVEHLGLGSMTSHGHAVLLLSVVILTFIIIIIIIIAFISGSMAHSCTLMAYILLKLSSVD